LLIFSNKALLIWSSPEVAGTATFAFGASAATFAGAGAVFESLDSALPAINIPSKKPTETTDRGVQLIVFMRSLTAFVEIVFILPYKSMLKPIA
jgi:hypothetical protein